MSPASRVSGVNPGPSTSSTSSVKSALSLATQVTGGGGPRTTTAQRLLRGEAVREHPDVLNRHVGMG